MDFLKRNRQVRKTISSDIPSQFPAIYREEGPLFVEFVEAYYEYLDSLENDFREAYNIRDIDTTYDRFLIYFKEKYLKDVPLDTDVDTRFIVKHIQDLYRRKGSEESLRLLFRLFFNEEIEVFYPANNILKPSDSKYGSALYLEMEAVKTFRGYVIRKGDRLYGDTSKARAFVDEIVFQNFNGVFVPIVYISNVSGRFISDDGIVVTGKRVNEQGDTIDQTFWPGKIIRGSIDTATVRFGNRTSGNKVGDTLSLRSRETGAGASAVVRKVTETVTGIIDFTIEEGGYGYSANTDQNDIHISNQVAITKDVETFETFDVISANNAQVVSEDGSNDAAYANNTVSGTAQVIEYKPDQKVLFLQAANSDIAFSSLPIGGKVTLTNETSNTTFEVTSIAVYNDLADFEIGTLANEETVTIITDVIGDFVSVPLNSSDYGMSGSSAETLSTTLRDAFTPVEFTIGEIDTINVLNEGINYRNDVEAAIIQPQITKFDKRDIIMSFDRIDFVLQKGDIITQEIEVEDLTYQSNTVPYTVRAEYVRRSGDLFYFRQKSFYGFDDDIQANIKNNMYDIMSITEDATSLPMGKNSNISGRARFELGQIEEITITDTGFRYRDGEIVELVDENGDIAATATVTVRGNGFTEGRWTTTTSFLNESTKVIRDNDYYQEYSYDVSSIVNPEVYETIVRDLVQVAGTKQFNTPLINSENDTKPNVDISFEVYDLTYPEYIDETNTDVMVTEEDANTVLVAVVATLDETTTNTVNTDIGN